MFNLFVCRVSRIIKELRRDKSVEAKQGKGGKCNYKVNKSAKWDYQARKLENLHRPDGGCGVRTVP